jgi:hypothetical protein
VNASPRHMAPNPPQRGARGEGGGKTGRRTAEGDENRLFGLHKGNFQARAPRGNGGIFSFFLCHVQVSNIITYGDDARGSITQFWSEPGKVNPQELELV